MSVKVKLYNQKAENIGEKELSSKIFAVKPSSALIHQVVVTQMANERQVLAHTKDRGEVRGGGRKPWKQKGTGRARHGSRRSPIWIGGGITFGPRNDRNFKKKINKKMKQKAIFMVLSDKIENGNMIVLDKLEMNEYKTKTINGMLNNFSAKVLNQDKKAKKSFLLIDAQKEEKTAYSTRNIAGIKFINLSNVNIVDLLKYKNIIFTEQGIAKFENLHNKDSK